MAKHLVLVGGGHAHMVTLANINAFVGKGYREARHCSIAKLSSHLKSQKRMPFRMARKN